MQSVLQPQVYCLFMSLATVKTERWVAVCCFSKIQIGFTFLVPAHPGSPGQRAVKRVCVCVCVMPFDAVPLSAVTLLILSLEGHLAFTKNLYP